VPFFVFFGDYVIYDGCCSRFLYILFVFVLDFNQINDDLGRPGLHMRIGKGSRAEGAGVQRHRSKKRRTRTLYYFFLIFGWRKRGVRTFDSMDDLLISLSPILI
jgi:hypothetical protein